MQKNFFGVIFHYCKYVKISEQNIKNWLCTHGNTSLGLMSFLLCFKYTVQSADSLILSFRISYHDCERKGVKLYIIIQ